MYFVLLAFIQIRFYVIQLLLLLLLLLKEVISSRLRESEIHPISPKTPAPQYQPIDRKKRMLKLVEDYSRDRAAWANKKPASPRPTLH